MKVKNIDKKKAIFGLIALAAVGGISYYIYLNWPTIQNYFSDNSASPLPQNTVTSQVPAAAITAGAGPAPLPQLAPGAFNSYEKNENQAIQLSAAQLADAQKEFNDFLAYMQCSAPYDGDNCPQPDANDTNNMMSVWINDGLTFENNFLPGYPYTYGYEGLVNEYNLNQVDPILEAGITYSTILQDAGQATSFII